MKLLATFFLLGAAVIWADPISQVKLVNSGNPSDVVNRVTIDGATKYNVYIGPYTLQVNGQDYSSMCIDFFDESHVGDTWSAYVTQVGSSNLSDTYHPSDSKEYEEDSYLLSQILKPGVPIGPVFRKQPGTLWLTASPILPTST